MGRNLKNMENATLTLYDLEYAENTEKTWKWEKYSVGPGL